MRLKWIHVCLAALFTVLVLFGGQKLYQTYAVARPVAGIEKLANVEFVDWVEADRNNPITTVKIKVTSTSNLPQSYVQVETEVKSAVGNKPYQILLVDSRTPELESLYNELQYYIQEGIFTGKFTEMVASIQKEASDRNVDANVFVDVSRVYVILSQSQAQLISVEKRPGR